MGRRSFISSLLAAFAALLPLRTSAQQEDLSYLSPEQRQRYEELRHRMLAALPYERVTVSGAKAYDTWLELRDAGRGYPVIIGDDDDLERIAEQFSIDDPDVFGDGGFQAEAPRSASAILALAAKINFPADLRNWDGAYLPEDLTAEEGKWPQVPESESFDLSIATDVRTREFYDRVHVLVVPARFGWEVPAFLRWGNWNACPPPEYHVAALRRWHEQYGAELVGINADTLNLRASRRPARRDEAMALAREQYGYCPDIVDQGVGTISALAATLAASDWWFFWWD